MVRVICAVAVVTATAMTDARAEVSGALRVIDGDTFDVGDTRVRLFGVDSVERSQDCVTEQGVTWNCGAWVIEQVSEMFAGRQANCSPMGTHGNRVVARCHVDGIDVGRALVQAGLAFADRRFSQDYDLDEKSAAVSDIGLHASRVQSPRQYRTTPVGGIPPDRDCKIKGNIASGNEHIYHVPGQRDYERAGIRLENGERWFCTEAEARAAGWRAAKR